MKAFLSHSSRDKGIVSEVFEQLGAANAELDAQTFDRGGSPKVYQECLFDKEVVEALELATLAVAATALIAMPLFALQVGIALTAPLTAHVIRSLGPVCVFALEQIDGRVVYSTPTLVCIIAYSMAAIASNLVHGWREDDPRPLPSAINHRFRSRRKMTGL